MIPVSELGRLPLLRRCWRLSFMDHFLRDRAQNADVKDGFTIPT